MSKEPLIAWKISEGRHRRTTSGRGYMFIREFAAMNGAFSMSSRASSAVVTCAPRSLSVRKFRHALITFFPAVAGLRAAIVSLQCPRAGRNWVKSGVLHLRGGHADTRVLGEPERSKLDLLTCTYTSKNLMGGPPSRLANSHIFLRVALCHCRIFSVITRLKV